ncbi:pyridoxamine 5'-phosphate oxidase family protein [Azospirillum sp. TSH64]|uniref:pyridoxamine 5'-phosphate oxidase family protein n=1 Tax=Azospirillum sp. TSH64 TaxID=652740 RepID=UPI000D610DC1|nr:pyridoxamine 5'-phosphate oxidase family protein [Azospirillum sp. TSH64]PWC77193.1 pyridoxamine 5'-phosphate oxidase [Azospirillum sp. TSH64]
MSQTGSRPVADLAALEALYGEPAAPSIAKEVPALTPGYRALIEASPFFVLATSGPDGLDASPRGDQPGFVRVADDRTLLIPDRRGNNRIDSLRNILADPRVGLLFLVPGLNETLRVNGRAVIDTDPALCESFAVDGKVPKSVLVVSIEAVFFQCARALLRSRLWDPAVQIERRSLPSAGALMAEASAGREGGDAYDRSLAERIPKTLY